MNFAEYVFAPDFWDYVLLTLQTPMRSSISSSLLVRTVKWS